MFRFTLLIGLFLSTSSGCNDTPKSSVETVTFQRDVAPILFARCASCHRPGEAAPFSLLTFEDAKFRSGQIAEVTQSRFMPPWLPEPGHLQLSNERRLSDEELETLARWHESGAIEGNPADSPPPPEFTAGWQLGEPDLVLESPAFTLPADGPDRFRNFVLHVPMSDLHWVRAVELRPLNPPVTHHIRLGLDINGESTRRDAADDQPGYEGMAWGADPPGQLLTWTPGMRADAGLPGTAWRLVPDMPLVLHTHLTPSGKTQTVRFLVGLHFADEPPSVRPMILRIGSRDIDIPPGRSQFTVTDEYSLPIDVVAHSVFPHAHSLCREILIEAHYPAGDKKTLLSISAFNEHWHDRYHFATPVLLPKGTRLVTRFTYDNTAHNIRNPHNPPQRVVYGSNSDDEMADVYLQVIPANPNQHAVLSAHYAEYELESKIVGYRKSMEVYPDDPWIRESLASCYLAQDKPEAAIDLLDRTLGAVESSPQAGVILAMAQMASGDAKAAETTFRDVLLLDDKLPVAWFGLGQALIEGGDKSDAESAFRKALKLAERLTVARLDLVDLLLEQNRVVEAAAQCELAIELDPDAHRPHLKLANIYAGQKRYDESLTQFALARRLAPYVYSPEASLAIACYQLGDEDKANELLDNEIKMAPDDPVPYCFLGQIARRNERWQTAKDHLSRAAEFPTPDTWPESHLRQFRTLVYKEQLQLAQQTENKNLARAAAEAWLKVEPENMQLQQLLHGLTSP